MASPFEAFIQLELPKRPYLEEDAPQESIIVRRGAGPRQLQGVTINEGEVLGLVDGQLAGVMPGAGGHSHTQALAAQEWVVTHDKGNRNVVVTILDEEYQEIIADSVQVGENAITISFTEAQTGYANILFI